MRKLLKPLSFIPALLLMYMIFTFSSQPGDVSGQLSYKVSCKIVEAGDYIFDANLDDWQVDEWANKINFITRKLAHITEYFLLAIAVSFPLYVYGLHGFLLMLAAGILCVGFAAGDEYHQSFVAGRGPSVKDVGIDSIGIFFGIIIVRIIGWTGRMTIFKEKADKKEAKRIKKQMKKAKKAGIQSPPPVVNNVVYNKKKRPVKRNFVTYTSNYNPPDGYAKNYSGEYGQGYNGGPNAGYGYGQDYNGNYQGAYGPNYNDGYGDGYDPGYGDGYGPDYGYRPDYYDEGYYGPDDGYTPPPRKNTRSKSADSLADDWKIIRKKKTAAHK